MIYRNTKHFSPAFTIVELLVAVGIFGAFSTAIFSTWLALQTSAVNVATYSNRQNDQMRVLDYLRRDIRRASKIEIYNAGTLVTGNNSGNELRLTIPDYYTDGRTDDDPFGTAVAATPSLTASAVVYGTPLSVRYLTAAGAVKRTEGALTRTVAESAGGFVLTFQRETSGEIRLRIQYNEAIRGGSNRTIRRQVDAVCGPRALLKAI